MCQSLSNGNRGRTITLSEAVGSVLAHDITEIRPGEFKGAAFKKGHVVTEADLDHLTRLGKRHLHVLDLPPDMLHEDDAVLVLAEALAGGGVTYDPHPSEGKINLIAERDGLFKVDVAALTEFNLVEGVMCASRHTNTLVRRGETLAGTRAIPLVIERDMVDRAADEARRAGGVFSVRKLDSTEVGLIVTGNEVYTGLIQDRAAPSLVPKIEALGARMLETVFAPDDPDFIAARLLELISAGAGLVVATGGMSVDPDDVTRLGVIKAGARDVLYGSAVLPGAMLMLARVRNVPVIGVPACVIHHDQTIFDLVLPRILAGESLTRRDLAAMSHGGLCLSCPECRYPVCPFGKTG
ncbi:MAG: molybdopterin-binding protein [Proteobacteria bacterium]|nr:molybdopterin-binding protein [Pseudomonadota bacterium]